MVWNILRTTQYRRSVAAGAVVAAGRTRSWPGSEPVARRVLRIGFGVLWILDGLLQLQSSMPLGLPDSVLQPSARSSPGLGAAPRRHVGVTIWTDHPVQAAASAVWIQVGIGVCAPARAPGALVTRRRPRHGRVGARRLGVRRGVRRHLRPRLLLAVRRRRAPSSSTASPAFWWPCPIRCLAPPPARALVLGVSACSSSAWPCSRPGPAGASGRERCGARRRARSPPWSARWPRPRSPGSCRRGSASFGRLRRRPRLGRQPLRRGRAGRHRRRAPAPAGRRCVRRWSAAVVLCLADWVLVQDLGFLGGVGTDPNSMVPMAARVRRRATWPGPGARSPWHRPAAPVRAAPLGADGARGRGGTGWRRWDRWPPAYLLRSVAAVAAIAVVLVGAVPMALAAVNPNADPILTEAVDGTPNVVDLPAPAFSLIDQHGRPVSAWPSLRGQDGGAHLPRPGVHVGLPVDRPGVPPGRPAARRRAGRVVFVAVVANPIYRATAFTNAFDRQEGLDHCATGCSSPGRCRRSTRSGTPTASRPTSCRRARWSPTATSPSSSTPRATTREVLTTDPGDGYARRRRPSPRCSRAGRHEAHRERRRPARRRPRSGGRSLGAWAHCALGRTAPGVLVGRPRPRPRPVAPGGTAATPPGSGAVVAMGTCPTRSTPSGSSSSRPAPAPGGRSSRRPGWPTTAAWWRVRRPPATVLAGFEPSQLCASRPSGAERRRGRPWTPGSSRAVSPPSRRPGRRPGSRHACGGARAHRSGDAVLRSAGSVLAWSDARRPATAPGAADPVAVVRRGSRLTAVAVAATVGARGGDVRRARRSGRRGVSAAPGLAWQLTVPRPGRLGAAHRRCCAWSSGAGMVDRARGRGARRRPAGLVARWRPAADRAGAWSAPLAVPASGPWPAVDLGSGGRLRARRRERVRRGPALESGGPGRPWQALTADRPRAPRPWWSASRWRRRRSRRVASTQRHRRGARRRPVGWHRHRDQSIQLPVSSGRRA